MTFLTPWPAIFAGAIAVPLLLLLYMLKLRRRRQRMASTLLWQRTFEDLQANVPFQRLRWTLLLAMQAATLLALLVAVARPLMMTEGRPASRVILLIDRSASMNARVDDEGRTRLDAARDAAGAIVERLGQGGEAGELMVVAFGATPVVVSGFESNRRMLRDAIDAVTPTDEEANLEAALELAGSFASTGESPEDEPPLVVLLSDGGVAPAPGSAGHTLRAGRFRFIAVGGGTDRPIRNIGIAAFNARRDYDEPGTVLVFARIVSVDPDPAEVVVTLFADDVALASRRVAIPPAGDDGPGETTTTFSIPMQHGAVLRLQHNRDDDLPADDVAALVLPRPVRPRVAIVHDGPAPDAFVRDVVEALEVRRWKAMSPERFEQLERDDSGRPPYEIVVFDQVAPGRLPEVPSITIGAVPPGVEAFDPVDEAGRRILTWERQHPLLRHVSLDDLVYSGFGGFRAPPEGVALATGPDGPVIIALERDGVTHVAIGFALGNSNWPLHIGFAVFIQNVLDQLLPVDLGREGLGYRPGELIAARAVAGVETLRITGAADASVPVDGARVTVLPGLPLAGLYSVEGAVPPHDRLAVSVLSGVESDLRVAETVTVNARSVTAGGVDSAVPRELWPWLVVVGLVLLALEWLVYCRRLHV